MKHIKGNLIDLAEEGKFNIIIHGCNCFCTMGRGIAKEIKDRYPSAYSIDCDTTVGDRSKLGGFTWVSVLDPNKIHFPFIIVNAYIQYDYKGNGVRCDYNAITSIFNGILSKFEPIYNQPRIGYPLIGAGLAKGDWNIISKIINKAFVGFDHTLVTLDNQG